MMFATKLLLRYAVKPTSPPRNIVPQEITKSFQHEPHNQPYATTCISKNEAKQAIQDADLIKAMRLQKHKLCSRSEPQRESRRSLSEVEQSIINHPNFEKAAALVRLLGDSTFTADEKPAPHHIGSVPRGNFYHSQDQNLKAVEAAVKIIKRAIQSRRDAERTENPEVLKVEPEVIIKKVEQKKPYIINIYLDTKEGKKLDDADIKAKIKQFWQENVKEFQQQHQRETIQMKGKAKMNAIRSVIAKRVETVEKEVAPRTTQAKIQKFIQEKALEDAEKTKKEEDVLDTPKKLKRKTSLADKPVKERKDSDSETEEVEISDGPPRRRVTPVQKLYSNTSWTTNPHTERLTGDAPPNYDLEERIKELMAKVTAVNTSGFSKYLTYWRDLWVKKMEGKERKNESSRKQEQSKRSLERIESDKVFKEDKSRRRNSYERAFEEQEDTKEYSDEVHVDNELRARQKSSYRHQQRNYGTTTNFVPFYEKRCPCGKSQGTTKIQIPEYDVSHRKRLLSRQRTYFSTISKPLCRCEAGTQGGVGSDASEKKSNTGHSRVDEFMNKFKNAMVVETKRDYEEVKVLYGPKEQGANSSKKASHRNLSKATGNPAQVSAKNSNDEATKYDTKKKNHCAKKNIKNDE